MAQAILTNDMKNQIILNALTKASITQRKASLRADRVAWAERVRLAAIGGEEIEAGVLKHLAQLEALAEKFPKALRTKDPHVRKDYRIRLNLAGSTVFAFFNGNYCDYERTSPNHVWKMTPAEFTLLADNPLVTEFYGFDALYKQIESDEYDIRQNVSAALSKVRTVKRLLEEWPEAKELLPADAPSIPLPPAIRREALNGMIGLPSNDEVTA